MKMTIAMAAQAAANALPSEDARNSGSDREKMAVMAVTAMRLIRDPNLLIRSLNNPANGNTPFEDATRLYAVPELVRICSIWQAGGDGGNFQL
jgi:hypothetical protein